MCACTYCQVNRQQNSLPCSLCSVSLTFWISTGVAIFCILVHLLLADYTFGVPIWSPPVIKQKCVELGHKHNIIPSSNNRYDLNIKSFKKKHAIISIETRKTYGLFRKITNEAKESIATENSVKTSSNIFRRNRSWLDSEQTNRISATQW